MRKYACREIIGLIKDLRIKSSIKSTKFFFSGCNSGKDDDNCVDDEAPSDHDDFFPGHIPFEHGKERKMCYLDFDKSDDSLTDLKMVSQNARGMSVDVLKLEHIANLTLEKNVGDFLIQDD